MTTYPVTRAGCHRWRLLINCSLTTIVLRLNEIQYCSIVAKSLLVILACHSLPKNQTQKIQKSSNKKVCQLAPVYPNSNSNFNCSRRLRIHPFISGRIVLPELLSPSCVGHNPFSRIFSWFSPERTPTRSFFIKEFMV